MKSNSISQKRIRFEINANNMQKWFYVYKTYKSTGDTSAHDIIANISIPGYSHTNGSSKSFIIHRHYTAINIYPLDASPQAVDWIQNWRVASDSQFLYLEFASKVISSSQYNHFDITFISLKGELNLDEYIPNSIQESVANNVVATYLVNSNFRCARYDELPT